MPLSVESEIDLLYHLSTMSEHVLPKGMFYLLLWKRLNQSTNPPAFSFNEMIEHLRTLYDESVFDNPELPESNDHDFEWNPVGVEQQPQPQSQPLQQQQPQQQQPQQQQPEKDLTNKSEPTTPQPAPKTRKRPASPTSNSTNNDVSRRSSRQKANTQTKDEDQTPQPKVEKRKSVKDSPRISTRSIPNNDSIGTRLRGQK